MKLNRKKTWISALFLMMLLVTSVVVSAGWNPEDRYQNSSGEGYLIARKTQESYDTLMERQDAINTALNGIAKVTVTGTPLDLVITVEGYHKDRDFLEFVEIMERCASDIFKEATWVNVLNLEYDDLGQAVSLIKDFSENKTYGTLKFDSYTAYAKYASNTVSYRIEFLD